VDPFDDVERTAQHVSELFTELTIAEAKMPHIVICRSPFDETSSYSGPYASGLDALVAAEREQQLEAARDGGEALRFVVAPLYPALDLTHIQ
jgi:hypothetical protein